MFLRNSWLTLNMFSAALAEGGLRTPGPAPGYVSVGLGQVCNQFVKRIQELAEDRTENKIRTDSLENHQTTKFSSSELLFLPQTSGLQKMGGGAPRTGASFE